MPPLPLLAQTPASVAGSLQYVIVTPARNEARYIQRTIDSMVAQTLRPRKWVIVDDGSTDDTRQIIGATAKQHPWITQATRVDRGFRKPGGGVIETFNDGCRLVDVSSWDLIVKLDADLSFAPNYFECIIGEFNNDPKLGIASGVYWEERRPAEWVEVIMPAYHAAGACKVIRRECFEQIGGFIAARGWDTVDEIRAMACGWRTGHFRQLKLKHWKLEGSGIGSLRTCLMHGEVYYRTGGSGLFFLFKLLHRMLHRPLIVGGVAMLWGYLGSLARRERLVTENEARCYRTLLNGRILNKFKGLMSATKSCA
jgi:poly-beta-1,6-N-acetyl-D-glucosamine synthase